MTTPGARPHEVIFEQASAKRVVLPVALARLSVELCLLRAERAADTLRTLPDRLQQAAPWLHATIAQEAPGAVSTCCLVDDYFGDPGPPRLVVAALVAAAQDAGLTLDYVMRASACAGDAQRSPARILVDHLVPDPKQGEDGSTEPHSRPGWLANGSRPTVTSQQAMAGPPIRVPPRQHSAPLHSVFVDVQLWQDDAGPRWSPATLSAVWYATRLGLLRDAGQPLVQPTEVPGQLPATWAQMPPVLQLSQAPAPFAAYRTFSLREARHRHGELAVQTILEQLAVDVEVSNQIMRHAQDAGVTLSPDPTTRIECLFLGQR